MKRFDITGANYACGSNIMDTDSMRTMDLETIADDGITLLSHFPWSLDAGETRRYIEKAHRLGIRLLPYLSAEKAWFLDTEERLEGCNRRNPAMAVPYYRAVDPSSHPEWILVDEQERLVPRYGSYPPGAKGIEQIDWGSWEVHGTRYESRADPNSWSWYMCPNAAGYPDAVEEGARAVMDMGCDGVFLDNVYPNRVAPCHGAGRAGHSHEAPSRSTDEAYVEIARRVYRAVKSYGEDRIVILNSGLEDVYRQFRDGSMIESYICTFGAPERRHSWEQILEFASTFRAERSAGRVVTALSYVEDGRQSARDNCFYAYACAMLCGFKWTASSREIDLVRMFHRAELLVPEGEMETTDGLFYRHYDKGMVVVNPGASADIEAWLPLPLSVRAPVDLYAGTRLATRKGEARLLVPRESGRVVVDEARARERHLIIS